jgi:hypothetical protein
MTICNVVLPSSRKMLPSIIFPLAQSETMESSQPTRSLANFLAPRNLSVSWPSVPVTPRTTKHICSKKTITRNISSKNYPTSQPPTSPTFINTSSSYLSSFHTPFPKYPQPPSLLAINLPYLDFWEKLK